MSADNYMAVRRKDGKWHVWMVLGGYTDESWEVPTSEGGHPCRSEVFDDKLEALERAHTISDKGSVEYGVRLISEA